MKTMLVGIFWAVASVVVAQNPDVALEKYLTDEVVAVGYLDLSQADIPAVLDWGEKLGVVTADDLDELAGGVQAVQGMVKQLLALGAEHAYVLFRVSDVGHRGPSWVVPVSKRDKKPQLPGHWEIVDGVLLGGTTVAQLEALKSSRPSNPPRDLSDAWAALGQGHCGLLVFGDKDSRRVVREMFPKLPEPFQAIDGPLIADRLLWGGVVANLPPKPSLQILVQTDANSTAVAVQKTIASGFALLQQLPLAQKLLDVEERQALASSLAPQVSGDQVTILFADALKDFGRLARLMTPPIQSARQAAQRNTRINKFKQIGLAILNYESARGTLPPRSTYADDGKPLLSWRVHVLPFIGDEELKLYKRFHLDEPWDSAHNKQLIPLMPDIYADPDPALRKRNAVGRTTYVVPTGQGTVFAGSEGISYKEITDGTSNTIMLVEIWSMAGPYWTRPKDWLINPTNLWERLLRRDDRDWITVGYCDGSVSTIPTSTPAETLQRLVIMNDGEVVERP